VHVETAIDRLEVCSSCGTRASIKDRPPVPLVDLPGFGRRARLVWRRRRWHCPNRSCPVTSWTELAPTIASSRLGMTDRAGRWATFQVGHRLGGRGRPRVRLAHRQRRRRRLRREAGSMTRTGSVR
jgi:hypothetical protein